MLWLGSESSLRSKKPQRIRSCRAWCLALALSAFVAQRVAGAELVSLDLNPTTADVTSSSQTITVSAHLKVGSSGLAYAFGNLTSPSAAQSVNVTLSSQNRISGTPEDGLYSSAITIPKGAEPGTWGFAYFSIMENDGAQTSVPAPPTKLTVTSAAPDDTAPQLISVDYQPSSVDVSDAPRYVTVSIHISDGGSGVGSVEGYFEGPSAA